MARHHAWRVPKLFTAQMCVALAEAPLLVCDKQRQLSYRRREMMVRELCMLEYKTCTRARKLQFE